MVKLLLIPLIVLLSGCSHLFFWPEPGLRVTPDQFSIPYQDVVLHTHDCVQLHGWWLPARDVDNYAAQGIIYFLHGNAENISTHAGAISWITHHGWHVFLLDYRGYGLSEGRPSISGVHLDAIAGLQWSLQQAQRLDMPLVVIGQSLGGTTALTALVKDPAGKEVTAVVMDSAFAGHRRIMRDKLRENWFTWPLALPLSWTITDRYSPEQHISQRPGFALLIMHSCADTVIPCSHSKLLAVQAGEPHELWLDDQAPHIGMLAQPKWRHALLEWLNEVSRTTQVDH